MPYLNDILKLPQIFQYATWLSWPVCSFIFSRIKFGSSEYVQRIWLLFFTFLLTGSLLTFGSLPELLVILPPFLKHFIYEAYDRNLMILTSILFIITLMAYSGYTTVSRRLFALSELVFSYDRLVFLSIMISFLGRLLALITIIGFGNFQIYRFSMFLCVSITVISLTLLNLIIEMKLFKKDVSENRNSPVSSNEIKNKPEWFYFGGFKKVYFWLYLYAFTSNLAVYSFIPLASDWYISIDPSSYNNILGKPSTMISQRLHQTTLLYVWGLSAQFIISLMNVFIQHYFEIRSKMNWIFHMCVMILSSGSFWILVLNLKGIWMDLAFSISYLELLESIYQLRFTTKMPIISSLK